MQRLGHVRWVVAAAFGFALLSATWALAGSASDWGFMAAAEEENVVTVTESGSNVRVADAGNAIIVTPPCVLVDGAAAECPAPPLPGGGFMVDLGDGDDQGENVSAAGVHLNGGEGDDVLIGGTGAMGSIAGGSGYDQLRGGPADEGLRGDGDDDSLSGGAGNDTLSGGDGADSLDGGEGDDVFQPQSGDGPDSYAGGPGVDLIWYRMIREPLAVTLNGAADDGVAGEGDNVAADVERVSGGRGNDRLVAGGERVALEGNEGNDALEGGPQSDQLAGGDGDDTIMARDGQADTVDCGPGSDSAVIDPVDRVAGCEATDPPPDTTPPTATLRLPRQKLRTVLRKGLVAVITSSEPARVSLTATISRAQARKLRIRGGGARVQVAWATAEIPAGALRMRLPFTAGNRRALAKAKAVTFLVSGFLADAARNTGRATARRLVVKR